MGGRCGCTVLSGRASRGPELPGSCLSSWNSSPGLGALLPSSPVPLPSRPRPSFRSRCRLFLLFRKHLLRRTTVGIPGECSSIPLHFQPGPGRGAHSMGYSLPFLSHPILFLKRLSEAGATTLTLTWKQNIEQQRHLPAVSQLVSIRLLFMCTEFKRLSYLVET